MKWITLVTATVMGFASLNAEEINNEGKITALCMISSERDYVGGGHAEAYYEGQDGHFTLTTPIFERCPGSISVFFSNSDWTNWTLEFAAPRDEQLVPGIYKDAARFPFNESQPGLSFSGCGRGCNTVSGEFEILEMTYGENGQIEAFAANFIQRCENYGPPLFGSVRYNSGIPLETRFDELFQDGPESVLYITKRDSFGGEKSEPILITGEEGVFEFQPLPYGGEGIEIYIDDKNQGTWTLAFAAPIDEEFAEGVYENADRYPFHSSFSPGIEINTPEGGFTQPQGSFKVLKLVKGAAGEIKSLALNFFVQNVKGEVLEGAIRYKSTIPVDLE